MKCKFGSEVVKSFFSGKVLQTLPFFSLFAPPLLLRQSTRKKLSMMMCNQLNLCQWCLQWAECTILWWWTQCLEWIWIWDILEWAWIWAIQDIQEWVECRCIMAHNNVRIIRLIIIMVVALIHVLACKLAESFSGCLANADVLLLAHLHPLHVLAALATAGHARKIKI